MQVITNFARKPTKILRVLCDHQENAKGIFHTVFELIPTNESRQFERSQFLPVSPWALEFLLKACKRKDADSATKLYRELSGVPTAAVFRGFLLKKLAQNSLDDIKSDADLKIRGLTDPNQTNWVYHGPIPCSTFDQSEFVTKINKAVKKNKPVHLVPLSPEFEDLEAVYSVVYHPKDPILTCVQVTMNRKHPISVPGLQQILKWLELGSSSAKFRPNTLSRWRFVFIVPQHMVSTYELQRFNNDTPEDAWAKKVDQCVMGTKNGSVLHGADSS